MTYDDEGIEASQRDTPVLLDAMVLRPVGLVLTAVGAVVFLPAAAIVGASRPTDIGKPFQMLVAFQFEPHGHGTLRQNEIDIVGQGRGQAKHIAVRAVPRLVERVADDNDFFACGQTLGCHVEQFVEKIGTARDGRQETNPVAYKMVVPNSGGKEYYLFENRQMIGFDQGLIRFGTHGLAIFHVDDVVFSNSYWNPNEAENWKEFRSTGWQKAWTGETHYGISIIQADDQWDLEHARFYWIVPQVSSSLSSDLYPGTLKKTEFSSYTYPNSSNYYFWGGSAPKFGYSGVTITKIQEAAGTITASLSFVPWVAPNK